MSGPLPEYLSPLTVPASWVYERIISARNRKFDRGDGVERLDVPVISVGNITTGGTGKTPMVMWIAKFLRERGNTPAIAMRGYGSTDDAPSDEAIEYAQRVPDVPLIVDPDRVRACRRHLETNPETDCIILDDGFQHRRLHRDLDLVLIDAAHDLRQQRLLPAGHLREPLESLSRADAVIVTRAPRDESEISNLRSQISDLESQISDVKSLIERHHGRPPLAWSRHEWLGLHVYAAPPESRAMEAHGSATDTTPSLPVNWLHGKRLVTLLGVGNPRSVIDQLESAGAIVAADIPAGDHERFSPAKIAVAKGLADGLDGLVMTAKDWARARDVIDLSRWPCPIIVPEVVIDVFEGRDDLERLILTRLAS